MSADRYRRYCELLKARIETRFSPSVADEAVSDRVLVVG
jgi:hypothetical protein